MPALTNYEKYVDCFEFVKDVESHLVFDNDKVEDPFITIVIPTYKRYDLIGETLESAINQMPVDFEWDIIVVDNEAYDGNENKTTRIIKSFNCNRIRHYRHSRTTSMYDNHNLGFKLARGKWIMMCHDDDILFKNTLYKQGEAIKYLSRLKGKTLGAIATQYYRFKYDKNNQDSHRKEIELIKNQYENSPVLLNFFKLTHAHVLCTSHIGGGPPSNGAVFNRNAVIEFGGFNDRVGIFADLVMFYKLENNYSVYETTEPYGLYRWGDNASSNLKFTKEILTICQDFRNYVFHKNIFSRIYGLMCGSILYHIFGRAVLDMRAMSATDFLDLKDYDDIYNKHPNKISLWLFKKIIYKPYRLYKSAQNRSIKNKIKKYIKNEEKRMELINETNK